MASTSNPTNTTTKSSTMYRQKALHEIRISLLPFMNNERPTSSASSTTSDSSSSPEQTSGIGSSVSSTSNGSSCSVGLSTVPPSTSNQDCNQINGREMPSHSHQQLFKVLLNLGYTEVLYFVAAIIYN